MAETQFNLQIANIANFKVAQETVRLLPPTVDALIQAIRLSLLLNPTAAAAFESAVFKSNPSDASGIAQEFSMALSLDFPPPGTSLDYHLSPIRIFNAGSLLYQKFKELIKPTSSDSRIAAFDIVFANSVCLKTGKTYDFSYKEQIKKGSEALLVHRLDETNDITLLRDSIVSLYPPLTIVTESRLLKSLLDSKSLLLLQVSSYDIQYSFRLDTLYNNVSHIALYLTKKQGNDISKISLKNIALMKSFVSCIKQYTIFCFEESISRFDSRLNDIKRNEYENFKSNSKRNINNISFFQKMDIIKNDLYQTLLTSLNSAFLCCPLHSNLDNIEMDNKIVIDLIQQRGQIVDFLLEPIKLSYLYENGNNLDDSLKQSLNILEKLCIFENLNLESLKETCIFCKVRIILDVLINIVHRFAQRFIIRYTDQLRSNSINLNEDDDLLDKSDFTSFNLYYTILSNIIVNTKFTNDSCNIKEIQSLTKNSLNKLSVYFQPNLN